jgi:hypothetical protein
MESFALKRCGGVGSPQFQSTRGGAIMQFAPKYALWLWVAILLISVNLTQAQPNPKLTPVNCGNIVIIATRLNEE